MEPWQIAVFLKPFVLLILTVCILYPIRVLVQKRMPEGKLKRFLLTRINTQYPERSREH